MTDRNGTELAPGDPVRWHGKNGPDDVVPATVLRQVGAGRYLIQMDPHRRRHSLELAHAASGALTISENRVRKAQFSDEVTSASGYVLKRPADWT